MSRDNLKQWWSNNLCKALTHFYYYFKFISNDHTLTRCCETDNNIKNINNTMLVMNIHHFTHACSFAVIHTNYYHHHHSQNQYRLHWYLFTLDSQKISFTKIGSIASLFIYTEMNDFPHKHKIWSVSSNKI